MEYGAGLDERMIILTPQYIPSRFQWDIVIILFFSVFVLHSVRRPQSLRFIHMSYISAHLPVETFQLRLCLSRRAARDSRLETSRNHLPSHPSIRSFARLPRGVEQKERQRPRVDAASLRRRKVPELQLY